MLGITIILILVLMFLGLEVPFCFLIGCILFTFWSGQSTGTFMQTGFSQIASYTMIAMPMFMIAGTLIDKSGISHTLIEAAKKILGKLKGGMVMTVPLVACFFGALSGSGTATCTTLCTMMVPELEKLGYKKRYLAAVVAACGPLGYMIPPNINAIIFNKVASETSVSALFLATLIPGVLWAVAYMVMIRIGYAKHYVEPVFTPEQQAVIDLEKQSKKAFLAGAIAAIGMPFVVMGGIYGGIFSTSEAGAVGCLYALIVGVFVFRKFTMKTVFGCFVDAASSLGGLMILFPMTAVFTRILVLNQVPQLLSSSILSLSDNRIVILLLIDFVLFISGFFVGASVLLLVYVPLLVPLCHAISVSQTNLCVIMMVAIGIGTITPPMAMDLFVASRITGLPVQELYRPILPFVFIIGIPMLLLVTYIPALSEWLPRLVYNIVI
ncbi:MAG: TRAP transporter large permease [Clostridiales Family XIII bacterium]|jgi:C4-dicarboxylate transporter DctM subunit|nr:TRAP transporter large permease [Clostridiales Family XIII bacterium]